MIKHVMFDFDGTMVDSRYLTIELLNELSKKHGFQRIDKDSYENLRNMSLPERLKAIALPIYKIPKVAVDFETRYRDYITVSQPVKGIESVIVSLKNQGIKLGIISSNSFDNITIFLNNNKLNLFDTIYTSENIFGKDVAIRRFLKNNKLNSQEVVYVGDECRDIKACKKNNVKIIAVTWGYDSSALLSKENPDFLVNVPYDINTTVNSLLY